MSYLTPIQIFDNVPNIVYLTHDLNYHSLAEDATLKPILTNSAPVFQGINTNTLCLDSLPQENCDISSIINSSITNDKTPLPELDVQLPSLQPRTAVDTLEFMINDLPTDANSLVFNSSQLSPPPLTCNPRDITLPRDTGDTLQAGDKGEEEGGDEESGGEEELTRWMGRPRRDGTSLYCIKKRKKCNYCEKKYLTGYMLMKHVKAAHPEICLQHTCTTCEKLFDSMEKLVLHAADHWKPREKCPIGGLSSCIKFHSKTFLRTHLCLYHVKGATNERPYACKYCSKCFDKRFILKRHIKVHSGDKPFECERCHARFSQKNSLVLHMNTHDNQRPHKCICCSASFGQSYNCFLHMFNTHYKLRKELGGTTCVKCSKDFPNHKAALKHYIKCHKELAKSYLTDNVDVVKPMLVFKKTRPLILQSSKVPKQKQEEKRNSIQIATQQIDKLQQLLNSTVTTNECQEMLQEQQNIIPPPNQPVIKININNQQSSDANPNDIIIHINTEPNVIQDNSNVYIDGVQNCDNIFDNVGNNPLICGVKDIPQSTIEVNNSFNNITPPKQIAPRDNLKFTTMNDGGINLKNSFIFFPTNKSGNVDNSIDLRIHNVNSPIMKSSVDYNVTEEQNLSKNTVNPIVNAKEIVVNKIYLNENDLNENVGKRKKKKGSIKLYQCHRCPMLYKKPSDLIAHQGVHTKEKPFQCNQCTMAFTFKSVLKRHMKHHQRLNIAEEALKYYQQKRNAS